MKFYIASSFENKESVGYVSEKLTNKGYTHTYDWTQNERASTIEELKEIGQKEKDAVIEADIVVVLLPGGKGSHIEMGMALGQGKPIYLYSATEEVTNFETTSTFYHLPAVELCIGTLDEIIEIIFLRGSIGLL